MRRDKIAALLSQGEADQEVTICGWVRTKRESKAFAFVVINDGSCQDNMQIIVDGNLDSFQYVKDASTGSSVSIKGTLKESPAKGQKWEVHASELKVLGEAGPDYPLQKKGHSLEFLREIAHLRPRTNTFGAMFRVRNVLSNAVHEFFQNRGFQWAHTPILTASDGEGAGEMFNVTTMNMKSPELTDKGEIDYSKDFFGKQSYLCVTGQLEGEFMAMALGDIYTFGPTFRAENSNTTRHLAEFWMIEPEMAFADLDDNMDMAEEFVKTMIKTVLEKCPEELVFFEKFYKNIKVSELEKIANSGFIRLSYTDAVKALQDSGKKFEVPVEWGMDLKTEHERFITENIYKKPVFLTDYPKDIKAFYMRMNDDGKTVRAVDLLVPGVGELLGGSQREERLEVLEQRMENLGVPKEGLEWYLDLRKYGTAVHSGFGLGFERLLLYVTGIGNIRDTIPCPRHPGNINF